TAGSPRSLHDALPIYGGCRQERAGQERAETVEPERIRAPHLEEKAGPERATDRHARPVGSHGDEERGAKGRAPKELQQPGDTLRSEEHTSELQSRFDL